MWELPGRVGWLVAVDDSTGEIVGTASLLVDMESDVPGRLYTLGAVLPAYRRRGIGSGLLREVVAIGEEMGATVFATTTVDATEDPGLAFTRAHGFRRYLAEFDSLFEVAGLSADVVATMDRQAAEVAAREGVRLETLTVAAAGMSEEQMLRRVYELDQEVTRDVPHPEKLRPMDWETWARFVRALPSFDWDRFWVAVEPANGEWVGCTSIWPRGEVSDPARPNDRLFWTGFTGVRRPYRGRGIATALKRHSLAAAHRMGIPTVGTDNNDANAPMLAINNKLGFVRQPTVLGVRRGEPRTDITTDEWFAQTLRRPTPDAGA